MGWFGKYALKRGYRGAVSWPSHKMTHAIAPPIKKYYKVLIRYPVVVEEWSTIQEMIMREIHFSQVLALRIVQHEFLSEAIFKWVSKGLHLFSFTTLGNWSRKFSPYDNKSYAKLTLITNKSPVFIVCLFLLRVLILRYFPVFWLAYMITMVFVIRHSIVHSGTVSCTPRVFLIETVISFIPWCKRVFDCGQTRPQRSMKVYPPIMENTWPK